MSPDGTGNALVSECFGGARDDRYIHLSKDVLRPSADLR